MGLLSIIILMPLAEIVFLSWGGFKLIASAHGVHLAIGGVKFIAFVELVIIGTVLAQNGDGGFFGIAMN